MSEVYSLNVAELTRTEFYGWGNTEKQIFRIGDFVFFIPEYWEEDRVVKESDYESSWGHWSVHSEL